MLQYSICAFLAPALASAAAFPWAFPEPTFVVPEPDNWSPAPTAPPKFGAINLFERAVAGNTCGYISAEKFLSLTCNDPDYVCVTNAANGVHGCCNPSSLSSCTLYTTCIDSSLLAASCTDEACLTNNYIAKCTASDAPSCYEWRYVYSTQTVMTEHGCALEGFTSSVQRTYTDGITSDSSSLSSEVAVFLESSSSEPTSSEATTTSSGSSTANNAESATASATDGASVPTPAKKSHIGAIVGGVVGGVVALGALAFAIVFLILRHRKAKRNAANAATGATQPMMGSQGPAPGVTEYKPQPGGYASPGQQYPPTPGQLYEAPAPGQYGAPAAAGYYGHDNKTWQQQQQGAPGHELGTQQPYSPPISPAPQYSGPNVTHPVPLEAVEAEGTPVPGHPTSPPSQPHPIYEAP